MDAQHVLKVMGANVENVKKLLVQSIRLMAKVDWADVIKKNKVNISEIPNLSKKTLYPIFYTIFLLSKLSLLQDVATNNVITK